MPGSPPWVDRLLRLHRKLFNDLENNLVHRHLTVCTVRTTSDRSA